MFEKNIYSTSKSFLTNNTINKKLKQEEEKKFYIKKEPSLTFRNIPRIKSALVVESEKELKKITLSSQSFSQYMKKIDQTKVREFAFKSKRMLAYSSMDNMTGRKIQSQRVTDKNLPNLSFKKLDINEFIKNRKRNSNHFSGEKDMELDLHIENDSIDDILSDNENNNVEEMPYGFKYKDTRIILDKDKLGPIRSAIFSKENISNVINDNEFNDITNIKETKKEKEKSKKYLSKNSLKKLKEEEEKKNNIFKFFSEGDFLDKNKKIINKNILNKNNKKNKKEFILKYEEANDYLSELYNICKNIGNFNARDFSRQIKYNIKNYNHTEEYAYELTMNSLCLKFIEQNENNNLNENTKEKSHKVYLPFTYLLFFYLLDFETFKIFLSEIIIYNEEKGKMEIKQNEIRDCLINYKKYTQTILGPYFNPAKEKNSENFEFYQKASYNLNERNFLKLYDWIVHIEPKTKNEKIIHNNNIIYKVKILLPMVKFNLITKNVVLKKLIHKNIIASLLKTGFKDWEKKILSQLFLNKKFRYIMNNIFSKKFQVTNKKRKIYIEKIDYSQNVINKHKYEFFLTDTKREHSRYFYISSYEILFFYGRNAKKFVNKKYINIKDSINLNKYSQYWGYINTIMKCLYIDTKGKKISFDFSILEKNPAKFFQLKLKTKLGLGLVDKNDIENLENFYNKGFIYYRNEKKLIDMYLFNFLIVESRLARLNIQNYKFRVPIQILDKISNNKNTFSNLNKYISDNSEEIVSNRGILNINLEEIKRRIDNKNLDKNLQDRLKRFSIGIINKSNTIKIPSSSINAQTYSKKQTSLFKRGVSSGGMGSFFGNSHFYMAEKHYKKSETKKFGGSLFINNKIEEKKTLDNKKWAKKPSIWRRFNSIRKPKEENEIKEEKENKEKKLNKQISFFNPIKNNDNNENDNSKDKDLIKDDDEEEEEEEEEEKEKESLRKNKKMNTKMKKSFIEKGEYFKKYMDDIKKQREIKYYDVEGNELFK